ncbi:hypothetical protein Droror1_Dr00009830 [Drosera rotundifolia]
MSGLGFDVVAKKQWCEVVAQWSGSSWFEESKVFELDEQVTRYYGLLRQAVELFDTRLISCWCWFEFVLHSFSLRSFAVLNAESVAPACGQ